MLLIPKHMVLVVKIRRESDSAHEPVMAEYKHAPLPLQKTPAAVDSDYPPNTGANMKSIQTLWIEKQIFQVFASANIAA